MDCFGKLLSAPHYKIHVSGKKSFCRSNNPDLNESSYLKPSQHWYAWCLLSIFSATGPIIITSTTYGYQAAGTLSVAFLAIILLMILHTWLLKRWNTDLLKTKYWFSSPLYLKIRRKRAWYPYVFTSLFVYTYILCAFKFGNNFEPYYQSVQAIDLIILTVVSIIFYFTSSLLFPKAVLKLPWIDIYLKDRSIPKHVSELLQLHVETKVDTPTFSWRSKEDLSKLLLRTAIKNSFFSGSKGLFLETIPTRFIAIFLSYVALPYLTILIICSYLSLESLTQKTPLALASLVWAAGSFSLYCHNRDELIKDFILNKSKSSFQIPYINLIDQDTWYQSTQKIFSKDGLKIFALLTLSLVPYLWSIIDAVFKQP